MDKFLKYDDFSNIRTIKNLDKYEKIVLFGAGQTSYETIKLLKEKNIICLFDNDCNKWGTKIKGYKINAPNEITSIVDTKTAIVISSVSYQYEIAEDLIKRFNIKQENIFSYTSEYCEKNIYNIEKIKNNLEKINATINLLEDNESKEYVTNSIMLRLTRNPLYGKSNEKIKKPYEYSDIVFPKKGDYIVDCGAYIGDTAEIFFNKLNGECKIYCIEPFKRSYSKLIDNIISKNMKDRVKCFNYAVSDKKSIDFITCNEDELAVTANIKNKKGIIFNKINMDKLDNILKDIQKINFIKMDIEGEEINALYGSKDIIRKFKPHMMISAYHMVEHIWQIPILLKELNQTYKIYAGHQPNAPFEIEFYIGS